MATYYALPGMTTWANGGGWSLTSGGATAGSYPSTGNDVAIFDANSGAARTIALSSNMTGRLVMSGNAAITFSGTLTINGGGGAAQASSLDNCNWTSGSILRAGGNVQLSTTATAPLRNFQVVSSGAIVDLATDIVITDVFTLGTDATNASFFRDNGHAVTIGGLSVTKFSTSSRPSVTATGIWTCTLTSGFDLGETLMSQAPAKIVFTGNAASATISIPAGSLTNGGGNNSYPYIELPASTILTWNGPPSGTVTIGTLVFKPGAYVRFGSSLSISSTALVADGSGNPIKLTTVSGTCFLTSSTATINYCVIDHMSMSSVKALNSTDGGSNSGITFVPRIAQFFPFF